MSLTWLLLDPRISFSRRLPLALASESELNQIPELRRFLIPELRRFPVPKLHRFQIPELRRFLIPELRGFQ
jgi:hypothetical protein